MNVQENIWRFSTWDCSALYGFFLVTSSQLQWTGTTTPTNSLLCFVCLALTTSKHTKINFLVFCLYFTSFCSSNQQKLDCNIHVDRGFCLVYSLLLFLVPRVVPDIWLVLNKYLLNKRSNAHWDLKGLWCYMVTKLVYLYIPILCLKLTLVMIACIRTFI